MRRNTMADHKRRSPAEQADGRMKRAREAIDSIFYDMTVTREQVIDAMVELKEYVEANIGALMADVQRRGTTDG